ncbi:MAG: chitobiase/beta-hexosaminidase C-terminal domain-containing protein [Muribaculaceae bacterium]|nr:chitobiase/beta-hexosaminidase C-terminal domain-containing protein [Muribaculaceae bacterium]
MTMMTPHASFENLMLNLTVWDEGASIWYTFDSEALPENGDAWTLYNEPVALDDDCTVRYFARRTGFLDSAIDKFEFVYTDWMTEAPELTANEDTYEVIMECATEGAEIRYTTDGSEPTEESELYTEPIGFSGKEMLIRARAFAPHHFDSEISEIKVYGVVGVDTIGLSGVKVCKEGSEVVIYSDKNMRMPIYTLNGYLVRFIDLLEGRNVIENLDSGLYIIGNVKIRL